MIFLQHVARDIISDIIIVNIQMESREWFQRAILSRIFIDGILVFLLPCYYVNTFVQDEKNINSISNIIITFEYFIDLCIKRSSALE